MSSESVVKSSSPSPSSIMEQASTTASPSPPPEQANASQNRDSKKGRRFILALLSFTIITILNWNIPRDQWPTKFLLVLPSDDPQFPSLPAQLDQYYKKALRSISSKPIMATFFEPVEGGCCGMTESGHEHLIKAWEEAWQNYGWETKILTEVDARTHPKFQLFEDKLSQIDVNPYNHRCFWRWLAMSMNRDVRGGWMSDYDFFPLTLTGEVGMELGSSPGFKSWSVHVPTLVHADWESWNRVTELMMEVISPELDVGMVTDMLVLEYLHKNFSEEEMGITVWERNVYEGAYIYKRQEGEEEPRVDCEGANVQLGTHLSHHDTMKAVNNGIFPKIDGVKVENTWDGLEKRAEAAMAMMKDYREKCLMKRLRNR